MSLVEALSKLNLELQDQVLTLEERSQKIGHLVGKLCRKLAEKQENQEFREIIAVFRALVPELSGLIDLLFMDNQKLGCEVLFVSGVISFLLNQCPLFLRKENCLSIFEGLMLVACKLFGRIKLTLEQLLKESEKTALIVKLKGETKPTKEKRNEAAALAMELQYAMQDFLVGLNSYRTRSFRQLYLVPEFFNCLDLLLKFIDKEFEYVEGFYANVTDRATDLQNIIVVLKMLAKDDYSLVVGLRRRISSLHLRFSQSTEAGLAKSQRKWLTCCFCFIFLKMKSRRRSRNYWRSLILLRYRSWTL